MTADILLVLIITATAALLFVTERLRFDLLALAVLVVLAVTGLVTPEQALSGFSNPAVVTVWAVFILSGGLEQVGFARTLGRRILRFSGTGEAGLVAMIMIFAGVLSAFMNNVAVAALMLPVVMDIARRTDRPPSRLLMPLAFGCLLGGLTTMIGTPPNILMSSLVGETGRPPLRMFDFAPVGGAVMLAGIGYMTLFGRRLLPERDLAKVTARRLSADPTTQFDLGERLFSVEVPSDSPIAGQLLAVSGLGAALGLNVLCVFRNQRQLWAPGPTLKLEAGDRLLVHGEVDRLRLLAGEGSLQSLTPDYDVLRNIQASLSLFRLRVPSGSAMIGSSVEALDLRGRYGLQVIRILREHLPVRTHLKHRRLRSGDILLAHCPDDRLAGLRRNPELEIEPATQADLAWIAEHVVALRVPPGSQLAGRTLGESQLSDLLDMNVLATGTGAGPFTQPHSQTVLNVDDVLLGELDPERLAQVRLLADLRLEGDTPDLSQIDSDETGLIQVILSPYSSLIGQSLRKIRFREKFDLTVLAIWREGRSIRSTLADLPLRLGDALLVFGPREKLRLLDEEPDFVVLSEESNRPLRPSKARIALPIMAVVLLAAALGWVPIATAAVGGAVLMVMTGCLTMEEAHRYIDWRAVFLIAGLLPLGIAMEQTGAARLAAQLVVNVAGSFGPHGLVAGVYTLTALATQIIPNPAVVVLMAPIAFGAAASLGVAVTPLAMVVAVAASASFLSPVSHPANLLIMGPGGYQFKDFLRIGFPLTLISFLIVLFLLPLVWPLYP